jgi:hypothetical protein
MSALRCHALEEARSKGLVRYFTGKPCKYGHLAERMTSNKTCVECHRLKQVSLYRADPEPGKQRARRYHYENKEKVAAKAKIYQQRNRERLTKYYSERYYQKREEIIAKTL